MAVEVTLPELGLPPGEPVVLSVWFAEEGDEVFAGDQLVEVLAAGSTLDVSAPATGRLAEIVAYPDDELQAGQVLGLIEPTAEEESAIEPETDGAP